MSEYCIYLKMPSYLRQWFIHRHGGGDPVNLIRGSIESKLLQRATVKQPHGIIPPRQQEGEVAINIPYSKSHDPRTYNYITETGKRALVSCIKDDFDMDSWSNEASRRMILAGTPSQRFTNDSVRTTRQIFQENHHDFRSIFSESEKWKKVKKLKKN